MFCRAHEDLPYLSIRRVTALCDDPLRTFPRMKRLNQAIMGLLVLRRVIFLLLLLLEAAVETGRSIISASRKSFHLSTIFVNVLRNHGSQFNHFIFRIEALIRSCARNDPAQVGYYVFKEEVDANGCNYDGRTPLHLACSEVLKSRFSRLSLSNFDESFYPRVT